MEMSDYSNELLKKDDKLIENFVWIDMFIMVFMGIWNIYSN